MFIFQTGSYTVLYFSSILLSMFEIISFLLTSAYLPLVSPIPGKIKLLGFSDREFLGA